MEVVSLALPATALTHRLTTEPPDVFVTPEQAQQISSVALHTANTWLHKGRPYYDLQQHEYEELFRLLRVDCSSGTVLFLATVPGQAIDELVAYAEWTRQADCNWMACGFETLAEPCPFRPHLQTAKHRNGRPCVFRSQVQPADAFSDKHLFCILNVVDQHVTTIVADATADSHYDFHLQIALQRLGNDGVFVWRVTTAFIHFQELLIASLASHFSSVCVATLQQHDTFDTHFIIARGRTTTTRSPIANIRPTIDFMIDRWLLLAKYEYNRYLALAAFLHATGVTTPDHAQAFLSSHASVFNMTAVLAKDNSTFVE